MKKIVLTGEFESSKKNLGRDLSKNGLDKFIKGLEEKENKISESRIVAIISACQAEDGSSILLFRSKNNYYG